MGDEKVSAPAQPTANEAKTQDTQDTSSQQPSPPPTDNTPSKEVTPSPMDTSAPSTNSAAGSELTSPRAGACEPSVVTVHKNRPSVYPHRCCKQCSTEKGARIALILIISDVQTYCAFPLLSLVAY